MSGRFAGLVAVVTGGASGIGAATTQAFLAEGARVAVVDLDPSGAPEGALGVPADVRDRASLDAAVATVVAEFGGIDVLVNNAGVSAVGTVEDNPESDWTRVLDINVVGMARMSAAALPALRDSEHAAIVNLCSIAALNGLPQRAIYSATKGAVLSLTYAMATDHVHEGVRVNCVSPGTVHTPFVDGLLRNFADPVAEKAAMDARQATGRMVRPDEIAAAILFLADPASGSITGTDLLVDGGVSKLRVRAVQKTVA